MRNAMQALWLAGLVLVFSAVEVHAEDEDPFKGKLFPPEIILQHKGELNLTKQQFTEIRKAVVAVQSGIAEYEWDMAEAYQSLMLEIDNSPIDEASALRHAEIALKAENEVKKMHIGMLVKLKNLLTDEQVAYLESVSQ